MSRKPLILIERARPPEPEGGRKCDGCTQCCRLVGVPELAKPARVQCPHCRPGVGCGIYADRPASCRAFECGWLQAGVPLAFKPNKVRVVFAGSTTGNALVAHLAPGVSIDDDTEVMRWIRLVVARGMPVLCTYGDWVTTLMPDGRKITEPWQRDQDGQTVRVKADTPSDRPGGAHA